MTFYEAALHVLQREGKPLHVDTIVELALKDNLLSHVGKSPDVVMQDRLLAMARRKSDRTIVATAKQTFGLVEWGVPEDPDALEVTFEKPPEVEPLRPRERHPIPSPDKVRVAGRGERGRKREEWEERRRRRKIPALIDVAFEILQQAGGPMAAADLAAAAREKEVVSDDLGTEQLVSALREDNRRRQDAGRRPAFAFLPNGDILLEKAAEAPSAELQAAVAYALGMPLAEARREERGPGASRLIAQAMEHRRQIIRLVRRRLADLDAFPFEKAATALLEASGFRDLKVSKRNREGPLVLARKREGLIDLRYAVRVVKAGADIEKDKVDDLRRDMQQYGAQVGMIMSPSEPGRDARQAVQNVGAPLVVLMCGEALAERCLELRMGSTSTSVEVYDLDENFFRRCKERGEEAQRDREARRQGREERRPPREERRAEPPKEPAPEAREAKPSAPAVEAEPQQQVSEGAPTVATEPAPSEVAAAASQQQADAAALAARITQLPFEQNAAASHEEARRREQERVRAAAHERIEAEHAAQTSSVPGEGGEA